MSPQINLNNTHVSKLLRIAKSFPTHCISGIINDCINWGVMPAWSASDCPKRWNKIKKKNHVVSRTRCNWQYTCIYRMIYIYIYIHMNIYNVSYKPRHWSSNIAQARSFITSFVASFGNSCRNHLADWHFIPVQSKFLSTKNTRFSWCWCTFLPKARDNHPQKTILWFTCTKEHLQRFNSGRMMYSHYWVSNMSLPSSWHEGSSTTTYGPWKNSLIHFQSMFHDSKCMYLDLSP